MKSFISKRIDFVLVLFVTTIILLINVFNINYLPYFKTNLIFFLKSVWNLIRNLYSSNMFMHREVENLLVNLYKIINFLNSNYKKNFLENILNIYLFNLVLYVYIMYIVYTTLINFMCFSVKITNNNIKDLFVFSFLIKNNELKKSLLFLLSKIGLKTKHSNFNWIY